MRSKFPCLIGAAWLAALGGCSSGHHHSNAAVAVVQDAGTDASDFRTLADYLANPVVQDLLRRIPRHQGSAPPAGVDGSFSSTGSVTFSTIPGIRPGDTVSDSFCFGPPAGTAIEVAILDSSVVDAGAFSFIEGSGDLFTIYTAFKSSQEGPNGGTCEDHQVVVLSGKVEANGSLSSLLIGFGVVGLVGDCGGLLVGDIQITRNTAVRTGDSCVGSFTPQDPAEVLVQVENFLVTDVEVQAGGVTATIPLLSSATFEAPPGFQLSFQSIQPPLNLESSPKPQGIVLTGTFPADTQPAGRSSQYSISNVIGDDVFFAPIVLNRTEGALSVLVNVGTSAEFDCECSLAEDPLAQYVLGYHPFDVPGTIAASQANLHVLTVVPAAEIVIPQSKFPALGLDSGAASFIVVPPES